MIHSVQTAQADNASLIHHGGAKVNVESELHHNSERDHHQTVFTGKDSAVEAKQSHQQQ